MGRLRSNIWQLVIILPLLGVLGCGGHPPAGQSPFPVKVVLTPGGSSSLQQGGVLAFAGSAQNSSGASVSTTFTYASNNTSVLNITPNGVACAGIWDAAFTTCTPGAVGVVQVTATALGKTSPPTFVFVHPPIDNVTVTGVLLDSLPIQEPCLSQGQEMTVEAHAYSQGSDITTAVGPFTFSANNFSVVTLTPINNSAYNFSTNLATAKANTPGITQIFATASGVSSTSFQQPPPGTNLGFFETCPIQNITLEVGHAGSGQTSFSVGKGTAETIVATVTDVMGITSLPSTNGGLSLSKIPLTWSSSQQGVVGVSANCQLSCSVTTGIVGAASITASCAPPTCNVGFPLAPLGSIVPLPVYSFPTPAPSPQVTGAISALVTGAPATSSAILATSTGCSLEPPVSCVTGLYSFGSGRSQTGSANLMPVSPNSLLFDPVGDRAYMGSNFGVQSVTPANFGGQSNPFASLGQASGTVLAVSNNGNIAVFSETIHTPNQVYVINTTTANSPTTTTLNISGASRAIFTPDSQEAYIFGFDNNGNPNLYIYSTLLPLQVRSLPAQTVVTAMAVSPNGAFIYLAEATPNGGPSNLTAISACNTQIVGSLALPSTPLFMRILPSPHVEGKDSYGNAIPDGIHILVLDSTGFDIATSTITAPTIGSLTQPGVLCPEALSFVTPMQRIELNEGTLQPINFFVSPDGTLLYVLASNLNSILIHNFATNSLSGIQLSGSTNPTPLVADMSVDGSMIAVAASDGMVHQVNTTLGGSDALQFTFPDLPDADNPFCTVDPASGPCTVNLIAVRP